MKNHKKPLLITLSLFALGVVFTNSFTNYQSELSETESNIDFQLASINVAQFADTINNEDRILIDVRTAEEFNTEHLQGAINLDFYNPSFKQSLSDLDKHAPYAIYCRSGNRTNQTLAIMKTLGFTNVVDLKGGINEWQKLGMKTCKNLSC